MGRMSLNTLTSDYKCQLKNRTMEFPITLKLNQNIIFVVKMREMLEYYSLAFHSFSGYLKILFVSIYFH